MWYHTISHGWDSDEMFQFRSCLEAAIPTRALSWRKGLWRVQRKKCTSSLQLRWEPAVWKKVDLGLVKLGDNLIVQVW